MQYGGRQEGQQESLQHASGAEALLALNTGQRLHTALASGVGQV